ncbi:uncharacterized protein LOC118752733 [Rhagoletis pomonella]|uniref:uncharacterized protein LOC118752733 n=1 Tax=Rhagoletis pomonella TaxID=28610 RepID=UPI00177DE0CD|nr:uncharacterized protein LOC118752733 [Rhagoletis pomonella]XP_036343506.1 uncharacterized protein LOC118752733 [Rhagoletis pomonella]
MFSCCRAKTKKDKNNKKSDVQETKDEVTNDRKRIIPTIKIETGKTSDSNDEETDSSPPQNGNKAENVANNTNSILHSEVAEAEEATKSAATDITADSHLAEAIADRAQSDEQKKSSPTSVSIDKSSNTTQDKINSDETSTVATANSAVTATLANHEAPENEVTTGLNGQAEAIAGTTPVKSCLSRHNSTHTSIKKKVNISSHTEIIEPDPLPPPPYDPIALAVDDDDVFSDSLPPPKRESMCAPYIEPSEVPETAAYAHGLPEWFNDERINDIGCIEPPVTPVGRDELELRRQRLYTDLLRAAHAAVEHNVRFTPFATDFLHPHQLYQMDAREGDGGVEVRGDRLLYELK